LLNAFKDGRSTFDEDTMNSILTAQPFSLIYQGSQRDAKGGSGVVENSIANYNHCARFTLTGATDIGRVEIELDRDNLGADLTVQIREGMDPANGDDGTLLKQVVVPMEFIPDPKAWWSVPINLTGLTSGAQYWLVVVKAGDAINKVDWIGEAAQDAGYPAYYRAADTGAWTANNALHFKVFSNDPAEGQDDIVHSISGDNLAATFEYDANGLVTKTYRYLPPPDGPDGGIRDVLTFAMSGDYLMGGS